MKRLDWLLCAVVAAELIAGAAWCFQLRSRPRPPLANLSFVDPIAARQLHGLYQKCESSTDWANLGQAYLAFGYFNEAEGCFRFAAESEPTNAVRAYEWAFALERIGLTADANREYGRAVRLNYPQPADCWYFIGRNWLREEKPDEARDAFVKAGDQPSARYEIARLLARDGKTDDAIKILGPLSTEFPRAIQPYLLRHRIALLQGDPTAIVFADKASRARERLPTPFDREWRRIEEPYEQMGHTAVWTDCRQLIGTGKLDTAESRLREALDSQWDPTGMALLAEIELRRDRPKDALKHLDDILVRAGPTAYFLTRIGDVREATGENELAARAWTHAVQLGIPADAKNSHLKLAKHYQTVGNAKASQAHFSIAHLADGQRSFWIDDLASAQTHLEKAIQAAPELAPGWYYLAEVHRMSNRPTEASLAYRRCLEIDPNHGKALAGLAMLTPVPKRETQKSKLGYFKCP